MIAEKGAAMIRRCCAAKNGGVAKAVAVEPSRSIGTRCPKLSAEDLKDLTQPRSSAV
jgi:hypothetical protein